MSGSAPSGYDIGLKIEVSSLPPITRDPEPSDFPPREAYVPMATELAHQLYAAFAPARE